MSTEIVNLDEAKKDQKVLERLEDQIDLRQHRQVFGWYPGEPVVSDNFTNDQVGPAYNVVPCLTIGNHMIERAIKEEVKYMTICT